jgi:hypothetical protein
MRQKNRFPQQLDYLDERVTECMKILGGYSFLHIDSDKLQALTGTFIVKGNSWFATTDFDGHFGSHRQRLADARMRVHGFNLCPHISLFNSSRVTPFAFAFCVVHENVNSRMAL